MFDTNEALQAEAVETAETLKAEAMQEKCTYWNRHFSRYDESVWKNSHFFNCAIALGSAMERGEIPADFVPSALSAYEIKQSAEAVTKAEGALLHSAKRNTANLLEKLVAYAIRTTMNGGNRYVQLSERYSAYFDKDVLEACSIKFVHISEEYDSRSQLNVEFELTNDLRCLSESLGFKGNFVGQCDYDGEQVEAYVSNEHNPIMFFSGALRTTHDLNEKTVIEQCEAYRAFNEKLQELVTKLYTQ